MSANNQAAGAMNALGMTPPENDLRDAVARAGESGTTVPILLSDEMKQRIKNNGRYFYVRSVPPELFADPCERIAERGGLSAPEAVCILTGIPWHERVMREDLAHCILGAITDLHRRLAKARADLERVTAERDEAVAGLAQAATNIEKLSAAIRGAAPILKARALAAEADVTRLRGLLVDAGEALKNVRGLISEAAMTGFNHEDGNWPERLFHSQQMTSRALAALDKAPTPKEPA